MTRLDTLALTACGRSLNQLASSLHDRLPIQAGTLREDLRTTRAVVADALTAADASAFGLVAGKTARVSAMFDLAEVMGFIAADTAEQGRRVADAILDDVAALTSAARPSHAAA